MYNECMGNVEGHKNRKLVIGVVLIAFGLYAVISGIVNATDNVQPLVAPSGTLRIEIVDDPESRRLGLSGRDEIGDHEGMLFVFDEPSAQNCFWMKDMRFSIDMVWLDSAKRVLNSISDVSPDTYPDSFCPVSEAKYGLEVGSGRAQELGLSDGETVRF